MPEVTTKRNAINFSAGPAMMPLDVLERAQAEFLNYENTGSSVMELSHRSATFERIITKAEQDLRDIIQIPDNYKVLFMQGGATGQFSAIPMNLMNLKPKKSADYIVTGYWSEKAVEEARKHGQVNLVLDQELSTLNGVLIDSNWNLDIDASYVYYCDNETISGIEFDFIPECGDVPLVCDASSSFLSKAIDIKKFGCVFASAQKNMGPAGVTVVIIREDLLGHQVSYTPSIFDYKILAKNNSLYNTPPTYGIYVCGLVLEWIKANGGLNAIQAMNHRKASLLYDAIDSSNGFYSSKIQKEYRSRMNVTFRILKNGHANDDLEKKFLIQAEKRYCMKELKGHRSVGGIRASLYNAITQDHVKQLVQFMKEFHHENL